MAYCLSRPIDDQLHSVGLVAANSASYVQHFCEHLTNGSVIVPIRSPDDKARIDAAPNGLQAIIVPEPRYGWSTVSFRLTNDDSVAWIGFTSGTQGEPKGVPITHANMANTLARIQSVMQLDSSIREYVGVPVYHSFGLGRCLAVASVGGQFYIPRNGFNLQELASLLASGQVNAISAVPTLWRIVLRNRALIATHAHKVRWIEIGSQAMTVPEKLAMRELFPNARIVQHYGLTEASRTTLHDISSADVRHLDAVGSPIMDVEVGLTEDGCIKIRGGHVARNLLVGGKLVANVDAEGWLVTSDVGRIEDGRLYFKGRADDVINSGGLKIAVETIEQELDQLLAIGTDVCVARIPDPDRGDGILVALRDSSPRALEEVRAATDVILRRRSIWAGSSIRAVRVPEFPVTDTGKVMRNRLVAGLPLATDASDASQLRGAATASRDPAGARRRAPWARGLLGLAGAQKPTTVQALFARTFPGRELKSSDNFVDLGGDSLSFVELSMTLEDLLGRLPDNWPSLTIAELARLPRNRSLLHDVDTTLLIRFVAIIAIVTFHFTAHNIGGSAFLLMIVAAWNFSRFQSTAAIRTETVYPILASSVRLALPTLVVLLLIQAKSGKMHLIDLALLGNFENQSIQKPDLWFMFVMIQLMLLMAAILLVPQFRRLAADRPKLFAVGLLIVSLAAVLLGPMIWDTNHLYNRVPHMLMWLFILGYVLHQATRPIEKIGAYALAVILPVAVWGWHDTPFWIGGAHYWIWGGCLILLLVEKVPLPFPLNKLIYEIGGASMFIYISHASVQNIWHRLLPSSSAYLEVVVAIVAGVLFWRLWELGMSLILSQLAARRRAGARRVGATQRYTA